MTRSVRFKVRLTPRAARDEIVGTVDGVLSVRVTAPPVEDRANRALVRLIAKELAVPASAIRLIGGTRGRVKTVAVTGVPRALVATRWPGLLEEA